MVRRLPDSEAHPCSARRRSALASMARIPGRGSVYSPLLLHSGRPGASAAADLGGRKEALPRPGGPDRLGGGTDRFSAFIPAPLEWAKASESTQAACLFDLLAPNLRQ